jgi:hypothetical protein
MLELGLAVSHAPSMFRPVEHWPAIHRALAGDVPQPVQFNQEKREVLQGYLDRIEKGFAALKEQLDAHKPDVLLVVGDDQGEVFTPAATPGFCLFLCPEVSGSVSISHLNESDEDNHVTFRCPIELGTYLLDRLLERRFELAWREDLKPAGKPKRGIGHAFTRPLVKLTPGFDVPVISLHVNAYYPPQPGARQCYDLGRAIAEILKHRPEKVAILASGGLSHDPKGPRAGWIDTVLDHWVLEQLRCGNGEALCSLFNFDSDTLRGGTGEIRSWIVVAGACAGAKATIVDYIASCHTVTGLGFAYWPAEEIKRAGVNYVKNSSVQ